MAGLALCNNKECDKHERCKRFLDEKNVMYINFKILMVDGECTYFEEDNVKIVPKEDRVSEKTSEEKKDSLEDN